MAPPAIPTVFPRRACAAGDEPAATTVPAPSLPTGSDASSRADSPRSVPSLTDAVTTGRSDVPATVAVVMSAVATSKPRSDGLIGDASTWTNTWLAAGVGTGTSCSESSSTPCDVTNERSSSARSGKSAVIFWLLSSSVGAPIPLAVLTFRSTLDFARRSIPISLSGSQELKWDAKIGIQQSRPATRTEKCARVLHLGRLGTNRYSAALEIGRSAVRRTPGRLKPSLEELPAESQTITRALPGGIPGPGHALPCVRGSCRRAHAGRVGLGRRGTRPRQRQCLPGGPANASMVRSRHG